MVTRLPRFKRADNYPPITISKPKQALLEAVGRFTYLSAFQLARLVYSPRSLTWVQNELSQLYQAGYLERVFLQPSVPRGSALALYVLANAGYQYLQTAGLTPSGRFRASEQAEREQLFLRHTLACNDLLIASHLLAKQCPAVELARFLTERDLKLQPIYVTVGERRVAAIPDGWVELHIAEPGTDERLQSCIAWELDRNTVQRLAFRQKIAALVAWSDQPYIDTFGTDSLTIAWVVAIGGERRLKELLAWTEAELTQLGAKHQADLFRFAAFDPAQADPIEVFRSPIWRRPLDPTPVALVELE